MSDFLPPIPREPMDPSRPESVAMWKRQFFEPLNRLLGKIRGIPWLMLDKAGSRLNEIETRPHSDLQSILDWEGHNNDRHISVENGVDWQAHVDTLDGNPHGTDHAMLDAIAVLDPTSADATKDRHLSDAQAKVWQDHVGASSGVHGIAGDVVGTTDAQTISNKKFGGDDHYSEFESDGTLHFAGDATVWKDVMFPMAPPKTTGAGNPTLTTYNGNMRGYSFAVNDAHDFDPQEIVHDAKVGGTAYFHTHFLSRSNDGTDRGVKWEIEYDVEDATGALAAPTVISFEATIPAGTAVNTPFQSEIGTFTIPAIARLVGARIKRIASAATAPSVDPVLRALHFHYEIDTVGSRQKVIK